LIKVPTRLLSPLKTEKKRKEKRERKEKTKHFALSYPNLTISNPLDKIWGLKK